MRKVEVILNGENGQRRLEVNQRGGFYTRHIRCPRPEVPSIFGNNVSLGESTTLPKPSESTDLTALLTEVDACLKPEPKCTERKPTVQRIERDRGLEKLNTCVENEKRYQEKSEIALKRLAELEVL